MAPSSPASRPPRVPERAATVDEVIDELAAAQRKLAEDQPASDASDPLDAAVCDMIDGWIVEAILGVRACILRML